MQSQNVFLSLVQQDLKLRNRKNGSFSKGWKWFYKILVIAIILLVTTYVSLHQRVPLSADIWYFGWCFLFATFGIAIGMVKMEWKNGTVGWWLTLPYSRMKLVSSKFAAGALRGMFLFVIVYCAIAVLAIYSTIISGQFSGAELGAFLLAGLKTFAVGLCFCPIASAIGVTFAIMTESRAKPLLPLFWLLWVCFWWFGSPFGVHNGPGHATVPSNIPSLPMVWSVLLSWVLSFLLLRVSGYLLNRQMNL